MTNIVRMPVGPRVRPTNTNVPPPGLAQVQDLNAQLKAWSLHDLEARPEQRPEAVAQAGVLLERAQELLSAIEHSTSPTSTAWDGPKPEDVAFFARHELSDLSDALAALDEDASSSQVVETCQRQRGRLMKSCSALHQALCGHAGYECVDEVRVSELADALRVRARFASFWAELGRGLRLAGDDMTRRLRLAGTVVAMLVGSPEYRDFRIGDRELIRAIQREILTWLRSPVREPRQAQRIWGDLMGFVEISRSINRRTEFQEHDEQALSELGEALAGYPPNASFPAKLEPLVRSLWGRYPTLDRLIQSESAPPAGVWCRCVRKLTATESVSFPPAEALAFGPVAVRVSAS